MAHFKLYGLLASFLFLGNMLGHIQGTTTPAPDPSSIVSQGTTTSAPDPSSIVSQGTTTSAPDPSSIVSQGTTTSAPDPSSIVSQGTKTSAPDPPSIVSQGTTTSTLVVSSIDPTTPAHVSSPVQSKQPYSTVPNFSSGSPQRSTPGYTSATPEETTDTSTRQTSSPTKKQTNSYKPFPDPKSKLSVIIQEATKWLPELGDILAASSSPNVTELQDIHNYIEDLKKLPSTPQSVLTMLNDLEQSGIFDLLSTPSPTTERPTTPSPFSTSWDQCYRDLKALLDAFLSRELWALKMFDYSGKPGHSILEGNSKFFGNYRGCSDTKSPLYGNGSRVEGNVCRLSFLLTTAISGRPTSSSTIAWDLCLPNACHDSDLTTLANQIFKDIGQVSKVQVTCTASLDLQDDAGSIVALLILAIIGAFLLLGTGVDLVLKCMDMKEETRENYFINGYDNVDTDVDKFLNGGFELRETDFTKRAQEKEQQKEEEEERRKQRRAREKEREKQMEREKEKERARVRERQEPVSKISQLKRNFEQKHSSSGIASSLHGGTGFPVLGVPVLRVQDMGTREPTSNGIRANPVYIPEEPESICSEKESLDQFDLVEDEGDQHNTMAMDLYDLSDVDTTLPRWQRSLLALSIPRNVERIFSTDSEPGAIECLHGIKALSMAWIILAQTYRSSLESAENSNTSHHLLSTFRGQILYNATFAVDTFFLLSGVLTSYLFIKECGKIVDVPVKTGIMHYVRRILRLTPPYMVWVMVVATLLQYVGEGRPAWKDYIGAQTCRDNWWINLFYINNVYKNDNPCLPETWYLASLMQFHVIAPLALIPWASGFKVVGFMVTGLMISIHVISNLWLQVDIGGGDLIHNSKLYTSEIYVQPYARVAPYAIGLIVGWFLWKTKCKTNVNKYAGLVGWVTSFCIIVILNLVTYDENKDDLEQDPWRLAGKAVYETVSRLLWGLAISWLTFACATGNGGFINSFLGWKGWLPLSRLTFCAYIVHGTVITFEDSFPESAIYFSETVMIYRYFGFYLMTYLVALVLCVGVESPLLSLQKTFYPRDLDLDS